MRVVVGMSGGVDSSLAAALAKQAGHDVLGVTMQLTRKEQINAPGFINHGSIEEAKDAKAICDQLGIPFEVWDMSELYKESVVMNFIKGFARGETPNPCSYCNQNVKLGALVSKAIDNGADLVGTGHYARILHNNNGLCELHRGINQKKDQSYFVASMKPEILQYCYFPLGDFDDKEKVRTLAKNLKFATHDKKDSNDICFLAKNTKDKFLAAHFKDDYAGNIVDEHGNFLRKHSGFWNFTIGQRQGLDIRTPRSDGRPRYVIKINPKTNQVVVGPKELLQTTVVNCLDVQSFIDLKNNCVSISPLENKLKITELQQAQKFELPAFVQIRYRSKAIPATLYLEYGFKAGKLTSRLSAVAQEGYSFEAVARGQVLVAYDEKFNSKVLLKAIIC